MSTTKTRRESEGEVLSRRKIRPGGQSAIGPAVVEAILRQAVAQGWRPPADKQARRRRNNDPAVIAAARAELAAVGIDPDLLDTSKPVIHIRFKSPIGIQVFPKQSPEIIHGRGRGEKKAAEILLEGKAPTRRPGKWYQSHGSRKLADGTVIEYEAPLPKVVTAKRRAKK